MRPSINNDNYIPRTITFGCVILFSLAVRSFTLNIGADGFTSLSVFIASSVILFVLFLALQSLLEDFFNMIIRPQKRAIFETPMTTPQAPLSSFNYERFRQEALQEKEREERKKIDAVVDYTERTFAPYMADDELCLLTEQVTHFLTDQWTAETGQNVRVSSELKSIDLMHFGWNISRPFGKKREKIALFLKHTFAHPLRDVEVSSIQRKLTNTEGKYLIPLCKDLVIDEHSTPFESYSKVT